MIKIITWNVNSLKMRISLVENICLYQRPDILLLQEIRGASIYTIEDYYCFSNVSKGRRGVATYIHKNIIKKMGHPKVTIRNRGLLKHELRRFQHICWDKFHILNIYTTPGLLNVLEEKIDPNMHYSLRASYKYKINMLEKVLKICQHFKDDFIVWGGDFNCCFKQKDLFTDKNEDSFLHNPEIKDLYSLFKYHSLIDTGIYSKKHCPTFVPYKFQRGVSTYRLDTIFINQKTTFSSETLMGFLHTLKRSDHIPVQTTIY